MHRAVAVKEGETNTLYTSASPDISGKLIQRLILSTITECTSSEREHALWVGS